MSHQKRTCLLLINLAVADLLVGVTEPIVLVTEKLPRIMKPQEEQIGGITNPSTALQLLASIISVFFLAFVSLERAYAVIRPIRHRLTNIRVYIFGITIVWAVGLCLAGLSLSSIYEIVVDGGIVLGTIFVFLIVALLVICVSYLMIRTRLRSTSNSSRSTKRNLRLSRTVFLVIAVSLVFWLPAFVVYAVQGFCPRCFLQSVFSVVNALHLANSMVNPFVYTFRMPVFKDSLKRFWRKRRQNVEIRPIERSRNKLNLTSAASLTTTNGD